MAKFAIWCSTKVRTVFLILKHRRDCSCFASDGDLEEVFYFSMTQSLGVCNGQYTGSLIWKKWIMAMNHKVLHRNWTGYESSMKRVFLNPAYWNEMEIEISPLGILAAEVWDLFIGTWCGLAMWKNGILELPVLHQKCCVHGQNTAWYKHVWFIQVSSECMDKLILGWQDLLLSREEC